MPNAGPELLPEAGATQERRLEAVSSRPMFGWECPTVLLGGTQATLQHQRT